MLKYFILNFKKFSLIIPSLFVFIVCHSVCYSDASQNMNSGIIKGKLNNVDYINKNITVFGELIEASDAVIKKFHRKLSFKDLIEGQIVSVDVSIEPSTVQATKITIVSSRDIANKPFDADLAKSIQAETDAIVADLKVTGLIVGIKIPGVEELITTGGVSDLNTKQPVTKENKSKIASMTKTLTATVILQLVQEGVLSFEDTLKQWLPAIEIEDADIITIKQLLYHISGIFNYVHDEDFVTEIFADPAKVWPPLDLVAIAIKHGPDFAPGAAWNYSNTGYVLLALIAEAATGSTIEAQISDRVFKPLGMASSTFPGGIIIPEPFNQGYDDNNLDGVVEPSENNTNFDPSGPWSAGAVISKASDLLRWIEALVDGELLTEEIQKQRLTWIETGIEGLPTFGMGIANDNESFGHIGQIFGYNGSIQQFRDVNFVVLINGLPPARTQISAIDPATEIYYRIRSVIFPDLASSTKKSKLSRQFRSSIIGLDEYSVK